MLSSVKTVQESVKRKQSLMLAREMEVFTAGNGKPAKNSCNERGGGSSSPETQPCEDAVDEMAGCRVGGDTRLSRGLRPAPQSFSGDISLDLSAPCVRTLPLTVTRVTCYVLFYILSSGFHGNVSLYHSDCMSGESHGRRSLVGYSPRGRKELDTTE